MSQPTPYTPTTDFSQQESINASGRSTVNTAALDAELANISTSISQTVSNLTLLQRDDGRLKDVSVEVHALSPEVLNLIGGFRLRRIWEEYTDYSKKDLVSNGAYTYVCDISHQSTTVFDPEKWAQFGFTSGADAAQAAAAAQISALDAEASAFSATASASSAGSASASSSAKALEAATSAAAASTKAGAASLSATNAAASALAAAAAASNADALGTLSESAGSSLVGFLQAGTGAVARPLQEKAREVQVTPKDFGAAGSGSDETAKVQLAISALGASGGTVTVPRGVKFNLKSLAFPQRCNLEYFADDDLSHGPYGVPVSNEMMHFAANANVDGIVNEWRHAAAFHPGVMIDVRKDVPGHDSSLGVGQSRTDVARASLNILDEGVDTFRIIYDNSKVYSPFSNVGLQAWRRVVYLTGIGTAQWASVPAANTLITGQTSGAMGHLSYVDATKTALLWYSGTFVVGEKLIDNNETTVATVTGVSFAVQAHNAMTQDLNMGGWSVGLPTGSVRHHFAVGGKIAAQKSRSVGQYEVATVTAPAFVLMDSCELATPNGYEIAYDTAPAAAARRLTMRKLNAGEDIAHVGAVSAHASVGDSGSAVLKSAQFNIASVTRGGSVGQYLFAFSTPLASANYRVITGAQFAGHLAWDGKTISGFMVFVSNAAGTAQWAPYDFDVTVIGGDI